MANNYNQELKTTTAEFSKQEKLLSSMVKSVQQIEKSYGKISASAGGTSGNMLDGALAKFSTGEKIGMGLALGGGLLQAAYGALPATQDVIQRATGYYNAGVMQGFGGNFTRSGMYKHLADGLGKFGIQSPMATAQLAQFYGARGVGMGGAGGYYEANLTAATGGAARFLNIDSNRAAAALENLTAGAGGQSMNLLRSMGIFTADPKTGKVKTQAQLFSEISSRMRAGRGPTTVQGVMDSFRRGNLGANLKGLGFSEEQTQMFYLSELYRADTGKTLDLSNRDQIDSAMKRLEGKGYINPQQELNAIAASEEGVLEAGNDSYIAGLKAAVPLIQGMNKAMEPLAASMGGLKAAIDALTSTAAGAAGKGLLGDLGSAAITAGSAMLGARMGGGKGPKAPAPKTGNFLASGAKGMSVKGVGVTAIATLAGSALGNAVAGGAAPGSEQAKWGNAITMASQFAGMGAMVGSFFPGAGTAIGAVAGGLIGGALGYFGGGGPLIDGMGGTSNKSGAHSTASGGGDKPRFVKPTTGRVTSKYGPRKPPTKGASSNHTGVDIANASGTPIVAAADGKVTFAAYNGNYGKHIKIEHSGGYVTTYSHMSSFKAKVGDRVVAGNHIGNMGTTGNSTGPHLHFEVKKGGSFIDPATVVPGLGSGSITATVTNGSQSGDSTEAQNAKNSLVAVSSLASAGQNGLSALSAALGFASGDGTALVPVPGSNVKFIGPGSVSGTTSAASAGTGVSTQSQYDGQGGGSLVGGGMISSSAPSGSGKNPVVINLNIKQASDAEARRFAKLVKDILDDETNITKIGRM